MTVDMRSYLDLFLAEAREHLGAASALQTQLEQRPDEREPWRELLRHAHSLKGMAATMGYRGMVELAHAFEDVLERRLAEAPQECPRWSALLAESLDCLGHLVDQIERGQEPGSLRAGELASALRESALAARCDPGTGPCRPPAESPAAPPAPAEPAPHTWRIELSLDERPAAAAESTVATLRELASLGRVVQASPPRLELRTGRFEGLLQLTLASHRPPAEIEERLRSLVGPQGYRPAEAAPAPHAADPGIAGRWVRVRTERLDDLLETLLELRQELGRLRVALGPSSSGAGRHQERSEVLLKELYGTLMELRLVSFDSVGLRLRRIVRELGRELGKEVRLEIVGGDVRLDRLVLDALVDPLIHVLRNALDHGIESVPERVAAGKPLEGQLRLAVRRTGDRVHVTVEDDGRGILPDAVRRRALDRGLIDAGTAARLGEGEALMLTTLPGFSTAREVSHISGRGVGLDVVRSTLKRLGGVLAIDSEPGRRTRLRLAVPLTVALLEALLVRCAGQLYAVPLDRVEQTQDLLGLGLGDEVRAGRIPPELVRLDECLGLHAQSPLTADSWALLLVLGERRIGLVVDEVLGRRDIVVTPLHTPLSELPHYAGAALLEDGTIALVLDPALLATRSPAP